MKLLLTIIYLGFLSASSADSDGINSIEQLLAKNTNELSETKAILRHIDATNENIKKNIEQQRGWLEAIKNVDGLLAKLNLFLDAQGVVVQEALNNITIKSGIQADRVLKDLGGLARLQLSTKQQITGLEHKLDGYQKNVLQNTRSIDNNILELTKLITRAVLPQLNGLQCSFDSLETSQINIEVELKSLARIKDISDESNLKLNALGGQLVSLNRTQDAHFTLLTRALSQLKPLNTWQIESALRELIISQKRIELDLETCEQRSSSKSHHAKPPSSVSYETYEIEPRAAPHVRPPPPPRQQTDVVQVWTHSQPNQQSPKSNYASAYAQVPSITTQPGKHTNLRYSAHVGSPDKRPSTSAVSWQQPLPWESVSAYQSVPAPKPKPNPPVWRVVPQKPYQSAPGGHRRPAPKLQPCAENQYAQQSQRPSALASITYGPIEPPVQSYAHQAPKPGQSSPQERASVWYGSDEGY